MRQHSQELSDIRKYIELAEGELVRAAAITTQTLRFHKQATSPQETTADQLFDSVLTILHGRIVNAHVELQRRSRATQPVRCFEAEIRQVLSNLITNALDAMNPGKGCVLVRSRNGTRWATRERGMFLTIADTGSGMTASTQSKLFDAFFTTKGTVGTGLGLWVSKEIVDRHRGALRVRSSQNPRHHGTVFSLFLPFNAVTR